LGGKKSRGTVSCDDSGQGSQNWIVNSGERCGVFIELADKWDPSHMKLRKYFKYLKP